MPAIGCTNQDKPGISGFPWPQVSEKTSSKAERCKLTLKLIVSRPYSHQSALTKLHLQVRLMKFSQQIILEAQRQQYQLPLEVGAMEVEVVAVVEVAVEEEDHLVVVVTQEGKYSPRLVSSFRNGFAEQTPRILEAVLIRYERKLLLTEVTS
jgi:hypothetical protein